MIPIEKIERKIFLIRGKKVMLDTDLAGLYGVKTFRLNEAVKRNKRRFPDDFMFRLTAQEHHSLRSQFAILETGRGRHKKYLPYVFTEQGVAMLSSVLSSERAIQVNVAIMRAFVKLRRMLSVHKELAEKLAPLERKFEKHDGEIHAIFEATRRLTRPLEAPKRRIGFQP